MTIEDEIHVEYSEKSSSGASKSSAMNRILYIPFSVILEIGVKPLLIIPSLPKRAAR